MKAYLKSKLYQALEINWVRALGEVSASLAGTLLVILGISFVLFLQRYAESTRDIFDSYFQGGQIGLPTIAVSGMAFIALMRHKPMGQFTGFCVYVGFLSAIGITAFVIGMNPGFKENVLETGTLTLLWVCFFGIHAVWFLLILFGPKEVDMQDQTKQQNKRVQQILSGDGK